MFPENIHTLYPPHGWSPEILGGGGGVGVSKAKIQKEKYEANLEFLEGWGWGVQSEKPSVGEVCIFSETT